MDTQLNFLKMKIFQAFIKKSVIIGIDRNVAKQRYPINVNIVMGFVLIGSGIVCNLLFVIYEAKTFAQYTQTLYIFSVSCLMLSLLTISILKMKKIFEFINNGNGLINTSELNI